MRNYSSVGLLENNMPRGALALLPLFENPALQRLALDPYTLPSMKTSNTVLGVSRGIPVRASDFACVIKRWAAGSV
jgi:hypothetical protein